MVADIAHELRTPLSVIQASVESALDGVRPLSRATLEDIQQETELLTRLISDLRDLSLSDSGQLTLRTARADLAALARLAAEKFVHRAQAAGIRLSVEAGSQLPGVDVDPDRISQVISNLLDNALRHTPEGGAVTVRVQRAAEPGSVELTVEDTGPGIPEQHLPHVFDRFYRVDPARSRALGGTGIGLAVVKQLVEAHRGRVSAANKAAGGAVFSVSLPILEHSSLSERQTYA